MLLSRMCGGGRCGGSEVRAALRLLSTVKCERDTFNDNELKIYIGLGSRASSEKRGEGVSEERFQAKQTDGLRARGPRGLEFRCGPAPERPPASRAFAFAVALRFIVALQKIREIPRCEGKEGGQGSSVRIERGWRECRAVLQECHV